MIRMSNLIRTLCVTAFTSVAVSTALPTLTHAAGEPSAASSSALPAGAIAVVNGVAIPQSALDEIARKVAANGAPDAPQLRVALRDGLIARELLRQQAVHDHFDTRPEVAQAAEGEKTDVAVRAWLEANVHPAEPTERQIKARYDAVNAELGQNEFKPQLIVVADQAAAQNVIAQSKAGQAFDALARQYSVAPSKANGGQMPWVSFKTPVVDGKTRGVPTEVAQAISQLQVGGVAPQPVKSGDAWVVVKLQDKRPMKVQSYAEVKEEIRRQLKAESLDAAVNQRVQALASRATIVR
ncbi:Parvulin-like peptidyl-prolyl isomerase [Paraburkholderia tropica]|nr:Parvulin-like peptidyl-prolyl isomerase [Paraburkholderia tropica]